MSKKTESPLSIKHIVSYAAAAIIAAAAVVSFAYSTLPALLSVSYSAELKNNRESRGDKTKNGTLAEARGA